jgi:two-component sensor histidine kinase/integral membrane sensor domain MASE1
MLQGVNKQGQYRLPFLERGRLCAIGLAVVVSISYFLAARLSLALLTKPDGVAVFWPAAGVAAGVLIAIGPSARWPVAAGAMAATIAANLLGDRNIWSAIVFALCNAGEALLTAGLVVRFFGASFTLDRLSHVMGFLVAVVVATTASGIGGTVGYVLFHYSSTPAVMIWQHWFASDALGILTVAPMLIGFASTLRNPPARSELIEGVVALLAASVMAVLVITLPREPWTSITSIALVFPLLLWLAARCHPVFDAAAAFIVSLTVVWTTTFGIGLFGDPEYPIGDRILGAQAGIVAVSLCASVLAALFAERRQHEAELKASEARLQEALTAGAVIAFDWDARTGVARHSINAAQILGFARQQAPNARRFLAHVHPDDRPRLTALVRGLDVDNPSYVITFRYMRPDNQEVWLEQTAGAEFDEHKRLTRLKGLTLDITARKRAEERQDMLVAELDHRVKNVLARVAVVAMCTREGSKSMNDFVRALDGRIESMAVAHSLLSQSRWHGVGLSELVRHQLAPYSTKANTSIDGPDVMLSAAATQAVAMVFHELVTNAAKYGALSSPDGRILVSWKRQSGSNGPILTIAWRELGGPPTLASIRTGYGTTLIRDLIPHELGGYVELSFGADGVCCKMEIPFP